MKQYIKTISWVHKSPIDSINKRQNTYFIQSSMTPGGMVIPFAKKKM